jgi:hypothetical protein
VAHCHALAVEKTGEDTISAQIGDILNNAESFTQSIVSRGDRMADVSAAPLQLAYGLSLPFGVGFATTIINSNFGSQMRVLAVLAPLCMLKSLSSASLDGILIKYWRVLDFGHSMLALPSSIHMGSLYRDCNRLGNAIRRHSPLHLAAPCASEKRTKQIITNHWPLWGTCPQGLIGRR